MFSARFSYVITRCIFKKRPNNGVKAFSNDLESSIRARIELCLVHHMVMLLDRFGLFPALKKDINLDNPMERDIATVFCVYNRSLVAGSVFSAIIEDEERNLAAK